MRNLKSKKYKKRYKDTSHWLDAVYRHNQEFIDNKLKDVKTTNKRRVFKNLVLEQSGTRFRGSLTNKELNFELNKVKNPTKALKKLSRSDVFSSYKERAQENVYKLLKEEKSIKTIKDLIGKREKFDPGKLEWNYNDKVYEYKGVYIDISNSPKGVKIYKKVSTLSEIF